MGNAEAMSRAVWCGKGNTSQQVIQLGWVSSRGKARYRRRKTSRPRSWALGQGKENCRGPCFHGKKRKRAGHVGVAPCGKEQGKASGPWRAPRVQEERKTKMLREPQQQAGKASRKRRGARQGPRSRGRGAESDWKQAWGLVRPTCEKGEEGQASGPGPRLAAGLPLLGCGLGCWPAAVGLFLGRFGPDFKPQKKSPEPNKSSKKR